MDRALAIAQAEPAGPVYLTLPREVLGERLEGFDYADPAAERPRRPRWPRRRRRGGGPVLVAARTRIDRERRRAAIPLAVPPMVALAEALGLPVFEQFYTHL